ncbi:MAG TPA: HAMP domain-containing sensor histidine kinase [Flavobacteriaceae bacterium]|nr:HAMP domain-containing sensor histidine kinase [Flavobacteriaceae bacterium]
MIFTKYRNLTRWLITIASFIIISLILWNTYVFFQYFKEEQRAKMDIWATAQSDFQQNLLNDNINPVVSKVLLDAKNDNQMIVVNEQMQIDFYNNVDSTKIEQPKYIEHLITKFENENTPIEISYLDPDTNEKIVIGTLYYGNSPLINKLKYYPLALLLIIFLFSAVVYFFYRSSKTAAQNKLWSGMAKETAHQIGTPLSSLVGWTEILKEEKINPAYLTEIEKDISRLQTITERFSKIGSLPKLEKADIVSETTSSFDYLKARSSKLVDFELVIPNQKVFVNLNTQLYSWTIENLAKNAIDAMKGRGTLTLEIIPSGAFVKVLVSDTGKGLPKKQFHSIFEPGYTTKKRGWGLGLSLSKRIIEEFHQGKIKVLHSEIGKGTTFQITLKTA